MPVWILSLVLTLALVSGLPDPAWALPFATQVVQFSSGANPQLGFADPNSALGEPTRDNGTTVFMGQTFPAGTVTPFNAPFKPEQVVSIGAGGVLIVGFDHPVLDDPLNPFGVDLIVFGNAFFSDPNFAPIATSIFAEPGRISVSQDLLSWFNITDVFADDLYPTLGFSDSTDPFGADGSIPSDFTLPVDPAAIRSGAWRGLDFAGLLALYAGSGGGTPVDIAQTGLPWIRYARISLDLNATVSTEIDGFSDVRAIPEPGTWGLVALGLLGLAGLTRARKSQGVSRPYPE